MKNVYEVNPLFSQYEYKKGQLSSLANFFSNSNNDLGEFDVALGLKDLIGKLKIPPLVKVSDEFLPETVESFLKDKGFVFVENPSIEQFEHVVNNMKVELLRCGIDVDFSKIKILVADKMFYPDADDLDLGVGVGSCHRIVLVHGSGLFYAWLGDYSNTDYKDLTFDGNPNAYDKASVTEESLKKGKYLIVPEVFTGGCLSFVERIHSLNLIGNQENIENTLNDFLNSLYVDMCDCIS